MDIRVCYGSSKEAFESQVNEFAANGYTIMPDSFQVHGTSTNPQFAALATAKKCNEEFINSLKTSEETEERSEEGSEEGSEE